MLSGAIRDIDIAILFLFITYLCSLVGNQKLHWRSGIKAVILQYMHSNVTTPQMQMLLSLQIIQICDKQKQFGNVNTSYCSS